MDLEVGDIIVYDIKNYNSCTMLILEHLKTLDFGSNYLVLDLDTGSTLTWTFYPIDKIYIRKII